MAQRIVIPVEDDSGLEAKVAQHFGRAPYFALIELNGRGQITSIQIDPNTNEHMGGTGHPHGVVRHPRRCGGAIFLQPAHGRAHLQRSDSVGSVSLGGRRPERNGGSARLPRTPPNCAHPNAARSSPPTRSWLPGARLAGVRRRPC